MRILLLLLILAIAALAQPTEWFKSQTVQTDLNVSSTITIVPQGADPYVESIRAEVVFIPGNTEYSALRRFDAQPPAVVTTDRATYSWRTPRQHELSFNYRALVETANSAPRVRAKIPFPTPAPTELSEYLKATQHIDSTDPRIIGQAYALAQGEDDYFLVATKIATWVKRNIDYNLSTLTADVSQNASWVLEHRTGVCDELTSLFIAMLRSIGIPAKFVSGIAFTNSPQFPGGWGAHGWAEVYFPGVGWVPFDPTFGEYGWVDPGHIKLKESLDPREPTTVYQWKARDVNIEVEDLHISAEQVGSKGTAPLELTLKASPLRSRVGFGSHNGIMLEAFNRADYYVAMDVTLSRVTDMQIISDETQTIIVPPRSVGYAFWTVKVRDNLNPSFQYEIPLHITTIRNDTADGIFFVGQWDIVFVQSDIQTSISSYLKPEPFELACRLEQDTIWTDEGQVNCLLQNRQAKPTNVTACYNSCSTYELPAATSQSVSFPVPAKEPGFHRVAINASTPTSHKTATLTLVKNDQPRVSIKNVQAPESVPYGDAFDVGFTINRESISVPQNVIVSIKGAGITSNIPLGDLLSEQHVSFTINSNDLYQARPTFEISLTFESTKGDTHAAEAKASTTVHGLPFYKRPLGWILGLLASVL